MTKAIRSVVPPRKLAGRENKRCGLTPPYQLRPQIILPTGEWSAPTPKSMQLLVHQRVTGEHSLTQVIGSRSKQLPDLDPSPRFKSKRVQTYKSLPMKADLAVRQYLISPLVPKIIGKLRRFLLLCTCLDTGRKCQTVRVETGSLRSHILCRRFIHTSITIGDHGQ